MLIISGKKVADVILKMELISRASLSVREGFPSSCGEEKPAAESRPGVIFTGGLTKIGKSSEGENPESQNEHKRSCDTALYFEVIFSIYLECLFYWSKTENFLRLGRW